MSDRISTKAGIFESGDKDADGVQYKDGRLIACRNLKLTEYAVAYGTEVICDRAFMNMKELRSVRLPDSLRAIGESAFSGCNALADITIPDGVTEIRQATFRDCDSLAAIELPASVTEIDKFAFGRGLTTLVVNAPEMTIDKYAFMNARDFATLMVPAVRADYYRGLLAAMRVKADVEEIEDKTEEPASLLDAFVADPDKVTEETKGIFKSNNMEEKKLKTVSVEFFGKELFLEPKDADDEEVYDAYSRYALSGFKIVVNGKEYIPIDLGIEYKVLSQEQLDECKKFEVAKFFKDSGAEEGWLYTNKACSSIEIEIPEDEEFCPNKATVVVRKFDYPDGSYDMVICIFGYDGKVYDCSPEDSNGISGEKIWQLNDSESGEDNLISKIKETHDNETDQILILLNTDNGKKTPEVYINQLEHCGDDSDPEPFFQKTRHSSWAEENILEEGKEYSEEEIAQLMFANYRVLLDEYQHNLQYHVYVQFSFIVALDKQIIAIEESGLLDYANKFGYFSDEDQDFLNPAYVEEKTKECAVECGANAADFIPGLSEDNSQEHNEKKKVTLRLWGEGMRIDVLDSAGDVIDCINALRKGELFEIKATEGDSEFAVPLDEIGKSLFKRDDDDEDYDGGFDEWYEYEDFLDEPEDSYEDVEKINMVQTKVYGNAVIELPVEESFDIHQIRLMWTEIALPDSEEEIYCGVLYKGKSYPIVLDIDSEREISIDEIWCR